jgi:hypothetical protein
MAPLAKQTRAWGLRPERCRHAYLKGRIEGRSVVVRRGSSWWLMKKNNTGPSRYWRMGRERDANEIMPHVMHGFMAMTVDQQSLGNGPSDHQGAGMYHTAHTSGPARNCSSEQYECRQEGGLDSRVFPFKPRSPTPNQVPRCHDACRGRR